MIYTNWQQAADRSRFAQASPNLRALRDYLLKRWGGQYLGIMGVRAVRGGSAESSHSFGAALDWRYQNPGPGRDVCVREVLPFLVDHHELLGVQLIVDYIGARAWNVDRAGTEMAWRAMNASRTTGVGQAWAGWLHIETDAKSWERGTPIEERFPPPFEFPPFAPEFGLFSLWPIAPKPVTKIGARGDVVRYLQGVLRKAGHGLPVDGDFGPVTEAHVKWFQATRGLLADGVVCAQTWPRVDQVAGS